MTEQNQNAIVPSSNEIQLGSWNASNPSAIINRASEVAGQLVKIIKDRKLSKIIQKREYVYVDGWATMGAMLGAVAQEMPGMVNELEDGSFEAKQIVRLSDGSVIGIGSARVGMDEKDSYGKPTWANRPSYARRSMAITRAAGKAWRLSFSWIMSLAGYATTPAEEMDGLEGEWHEEAQKPAQPSPAPKEMHTTPPAEPLANIRQRKWKSDKLTWQMAESIASADGTRYVDIDGGKLEHMRRSLVKSIAETPDDEKNLKLDTILAIQDADKEA